MTVTRFALVALGYLAGCGGDEFCSVGEDSSFPFRVRVVEAATAETICEQATVVEARSVSTDASFELVAIQQNSTSTSTGRTCVYLPPKGLSRFDALYTIEADNPSYKPSASPRVAVSQARCGWKLTEAIVYFTRN